MTKRNPLACSVCDYTAESEGRFLRHMRTRHPEWKPDGDRRTDQRTYEEQPPPASAAAGADNPEDLIREAEQAASGLGVRAPRGSSESTRRKRLELIEQARIERERVEALTELCKTFAPLPYEGLALWLSEPKWAQYLSRPASTDEESTRLDLLAGAYARLAVAFNFDFSGKYSAIAAVIVVNARVIGAIGAEIAAEHPKVEDNSQPQIAVN